MTKSPLDLVKEIRDRLPKPALILDGQVETKHFRDGAVITSKIKAGAITTDKIVAGAVTQAKLGVSVGGGNVLENSSFEDSDVSMWTNYHDSSLVRSVVNPAYQGAARMECTSANDGWGLFGLAHGPVGMPAGPIVFSAWVLSTTGIESRVYLANTNGGDTPGPWITLVPNVWTRLSLTFTLATPRSVYPYIMGNNPTNLNTLFMAVDAVQLEIGDVPTSWAPNPSEILPGSVGTAQLANDAVIASKILNGTVTDAELADASVIASKIAAGAVIAGKIAAGTIVAADIAADTITAAKIAADAITSSELAANAVTTNKIVANAITAAKLEAILVMASKIVAGTAGAGRIELGYDTDPASQTFGQTVLVAYAADGTTQTFGLNAQSGEIFVRGRMDFGQSLLSRIRTDDVIEISPTAPGYAVGGQVQEREFVGGPGTSISPYWGTPTSKGALLLAAITAYNPSGAAPTISAPAGWTTGPSVTRAWISGNARLTVFYRENSATRSGSEAFTFGGVSCESTAIMSEWSGLDLADNSASASGSSTSMASGTVASPSQNQETWYAVGTFVTPKTFGAPSNGFTSLGLATRSDLTTTIAYKNVLTAASASTAWSLSPTSEWLGALLCLKARNVAGKPVTPNTGQVLIYNSAGRLGTIDSDGDIAFIETLHDSTKRGLYIFDDFFAPVAVGSAVGLNSFNFGTGSAITGTPGLQTHPGVWAFECGSTNSGRAGMAGSGNGPILLGGGRLRIGWIIRTPATLSNGTDRYSLEVGLWDTTTVLLSMVDAVFFRYQDNVNIGTGNARWQGQVTATGQGGGTTDPLSGFAFDVAGTTWYKLEVEVDAAAGVATFWINDVLAGTITSANIPKTAGHEVRPYCAIEKVAGTTNRIMYIDTYYVEHDLTTPR